MLLKPKTASVFTLVIDLDNLSGQVIEIDKSSGRLIKVNKMSRLIIIIIIRFVKRQNVKRLPWR